MHVTQAECSHGLHIVSNEWRNFWNPTRLCSDTLRSPVYPRPIERRLRIPIGFLGSGMVEKDRGDSVLLMYAWSEKKRDVTKRPCQFP